MEAVPPFASKPARATSVFTKFAWCPILWLGDFLSRGVGRRMARLLLYPFFFLPRRLHQPLQQDLWLVLELPQPPCR